MSTGIIRSKAPNSPGCPRNTEYCQSYQTHFDICVEKRMSSSPQPAYIHTWGLGDRELIIERIYDEGCDPLYSPFYCGGEEMCLTEEFPDTVLTMPGKYRFRVKGETPYSDEEDYEPLGWDDGFGYEYCPVHPEYAELWLNQQHLHCCRTK